jgi:GNAT superfamily N-acetyltransferase
LIIRRALVTDIFELSRLWLAMVMETDSTFEPNLDMWRGYIVNLMKYPGYFMFVAEYENRIVGFIDYSMQPEPARGYWKAVGNYFYILPEFRGGEVGRELWNAHESSARENQAKELFSFCYPETLEYWENHGFKKQCFAIRRVI